MVLTISTITAVQSAVNTNLITNFTYFGTGTGTTAATTSDTTLEAETYQSAVQESTNLTTSVIFSGFQNALQNNSNAINEIGFKTGSAGTLRQRKVLETANRITKDATKEVWLDLEITNSVTQ